jgi:hypothetical protein
VEAINILKTVTVLVARNADNAIVVPEVGLVVSAFCRSLDSGDRFCVAALRRNMVLVSVK